MAEKIMVAMSGGVDSSAAAAFLLEQGHKVSGGIMKLCNSAVDDAQKVCDKLKIDLHIFDYTKEFEDEVIKDFANSYFMGRTPNPCILCNKKFKFGRFLKRAEELGFDKIATGHYANIVKDDLTGIYYVERSENNAKDQSYFLYGMTQYQLARTIFPLKNMDKEFIRRKAAELGLISAEKKDSQDICFVPDKDYVGFIKKKYGDKYCAPGNFVDTSGNVIGNHNGIINYTIGQRNGLGMGFGKRMYVVSINPENNSVVLGSDDDVFSTGLIATEPCFADGIDNIPENGLKTFAKVRYRSVPAECTVYKEGSEKIRVIFKDKVRAVTPGQSVVFYENSKIIGGGVIDNSF